MRSLRSSLPIITTLVVTIAACGGGGSTAGAADPATAASPSQPAVEAPSSAIVETPPSEVPPSVGAGTEPSTAGVGAGAGVCDLATNDELAGILDQGVATTVIAGPPDTCDIQSTDGAPLAAMTLTNMQGVSASLVFDAFAGSPTAQAITGIGEKASYDPSQGTLLVLKDGAVLAIAVFEDGSKDAAALLDLMKRIGATAAGRM